MVLVKLRLYRKFGISTPWWANLVKLDHLPVENRFD